MSLAAFLLETVLISLSGVMMPGPITAVTIGKGSESPHAGAKIAVGHAVVEFPLIAAFYYGLGRLLDIMYVRAGIGLVGGLFLLFMSFSMFLGIREAEFKSGKYASAPVTAGILLSLGNPYFLVWWATIGSSLIMRSIGFGFTGIVLFALVHWVCDLVWDYILSTLSFKGGKLMGKIFQKIVFSLCGASLLFFGSKFIYDGIKNIISTAGS
jgi:threonine/homoserine/homoserine lactone efflux protein